MARSTVLPRLLVVVLAIIATVTVMINNARWRGGTPAEDGDGDVPSVVDAQWERDVVAGQLARTEAKLEDALGRLATAEHDVKASKAAAHTAQAAAHGCQAALDRAHADHAAAAEACRAEVAKAAAERDRATAAVEQLRARAAELESARAHADKAASAAQTAVQRCQKDLEATAQRLAAAEDAAGRSREAVALALQPDVALDAGAATAGVWATLCPALPDAATAVQHDKEAARLMGGLAAAWLVLPQLPALDVLGTLALAAPTLREDLCRVRRLAPLLPPLPTNAKQLRPWLHETAAAVSAHLGVYRSALARVLVPWLALVVLRRGGAGRVATALTALSAVLSPALPAVAALLWTAGRGRPHKPAADATPISDDWVKVPHPKAAAPPPPPSVPSTPQRRPPSQAATPASLRDLDGTTLADLDVSSQLSEPPEQSLGDTPGLLGGALGPDAAPSTSSKLRRVSFAPQTPLKIDDDADEPTDVTPRRRSSVRDRPATPYSGPPEHLRPLDPESTDAIAVAAPNTPPHQLRSLLPQSTLMKRHSQTPADILRLSPRSAPVELYLSP